MNHSTNHPILLELPNLEATQALGQVLGRSLPAGSILLLDGDLGSGKTTLVNAIGKGLGIADPIISPTFVLVNEYEGGRLPLYHFDLYRLNSSDVEDLHIEHYWDDMEHEPGIVAIEWAERMGDRPPYALVIQLSMAPRINQHPSKNVALESLRPPSEQQRYAMLTLEGNWRSPVTLCWEAVQDLERAIPQSHST